MALILLIMAYCYHVPLAMIVVAWLNLGWAIARIILEFFRACDDNFDL